MEKEFNEIINKYNINNKDEENRYIWNNILIYIRDKYIVVRGKIPLEVAKTIHNNNYDTKYNIRLNGTINNANPIEFSTDDIYEEEMNNYINNSKLISSYIDKLLKANEEFNKRNDKDKYIKFYHIDNTEGLDVLLNELNNYYKNNNNKSKENNVTSYYVLCNKLKHIIRTGWKIWNVKSDRLESVAEHIFSTQMLAIAMQSEYNYDIDLKKVILMLAVHELEEIFIGDIPLTSKEHDNKQEIGHEAVKKVLSSLMNKDQIEKLILEFDERKTKEALFAYHCDKLDCDLQEKIYDESGYIDLYNQPNNEEYNSFIVQRMIQDRARSVTDIWYAFDEHLYSDDNFKKVFTYAKRNKITGNN